LRFEKSQCDSYIRFFGEKVKKKMQALARVAPRDDHQSAARAIGWTVCDGRTSLMTRVRMDFVASIDDEEPASTMGENGALDDNV
jgi:hypothetical protein